MAEGGLETSPTTRLLGRFYPQRAKALSTAKVGWRKNCVVNVLFATNSAAASSDPYSFARVQIRRVPIADD